MIFQKTLIHGLVNRLRGIPCKLPSVGRTYNHMNLRPILFTLVIAFGIHSTQGQETLEEIVSALASDSFNERESATQRLLDYVKKDTKTLYGPLLSLYADRDLDPEAKARLLNGIRHVVRDFDFKKRGGFIGIQIRPFMDRDPENPAEVKRQGVSVLLVMPGKQGDKAGLRLGDKIFSLNGKPLAAQGFADLSAEFIKTVQWLTPGEKLTLGIERRGKDITLDVELGDTPEDVNIDRTKPYYYDEDRHFEEWFPKHLEAKLKALESAKKPKADSSL